MIHECVTLQLAVYHLQIAEQGSAEISRLATENHLTRGTVYFLALSLMSDAEAPTSMS